MAINEGTNMELTQEDREYTIAILNFFWPSQKLTSDQITERLVNFAADTLESASTCSDNMDLVPRPVGIKPNPKWALKQIRKIGKRFIKNDPKIYFICKKSVAYSKRGDFNNALAGL